MILLQSDDLRKRDIQNGGCMNTMTQLSCEYDVITSCCSHLERSVVKPSNFHHHCLDILEVIMGGGEKSCSGCRKKARSE